MPPSGSQPAAAADPNILRLGDCFADLRGAFFEDFGAFDHFADNAFQEVLAAALLIAASAGPQQQ